MDFQIGRFIDFLDAHKLRDNSWITFTSDNGPVRGEGGSTGGFRGNKASIYEGGNREPAIMYWKGKLQQGDVVDAPLSFFDFVPTLYDLFQMKPLNNYELDGKSMLPVFAARQHEEKAMVWLGKMEASVRMGDFKIIGKFGEYTKKQTLSEYLKKRELIEFELYDLSKDPCETKDLCSTDAEKLLEMKNLLIEKVKSVQNEIPTWNGKNVLPARNNFV